VKVRNNQLLCPWRFVLVSERSFGSHVAVAVWLRNIEGLDGKHGPVGSELKAWWCAREEKEEN